MADGWKPYYLSTVQRCQRCGTRLANPLPETCHGCHKILADAGVWSEFKEWEGERRSGCSRYVIRHMIWFGVITLVAAMATYAVSHVVAREPDWRSGLSFWCMMFVMTSIFAYFRWHWAERDYTEWKKRQTTPG